MKKIIVLCVVGLLIVLNAYAQDVSIDGSGNVTTGTTNTNGGNLEVTGVSDEDAIRGSTSGANAAGVYGENASSGVGVYGYSSTGDAGYFQGNTKVTGNLTIDGDITFGAAAGGQTMTFGASGVDTSVFNGAVSFNDSVNYSWGSATENMVLSNSTTGNADTLFLIELTGDTASLNDGIKIRSTGVTSPIHDGIDVSDVNITNAINIGRNDITGDNIWFEGALGNLWATGTVNAAAFSGDGSALTNVPDTTCLDGGVTCNFAGSASEGGPATTALSLNANGTNCTVGQYPLGVNASGDAEGCAVDDDIPDNDSEVPDAITVSGEVTSSANINLNTTASTINGRISYDATADRFGIGDGTTVDYFYPGPHTTDTTLSESEVDAFVANNGYLTGNLLTGFVAAYDGVKLVSGTIYDDLVNDRIGIGTTNPSEKLHIVKSAGATSGWPTGSDLLIDSGDPQRYITLRGPNSGQTGIIFSNPDNAWDGGLRYYPHSTTGSERLEFRSGGTDGINVMGDGKVGIGTISPAEKLDVSGTTKTIQLNVGDGTAVAPSYTFSVDTNTGIYRPTIDSISFSTAGSERVRINASGNVGIGTTSPSYKLDVQTISAFTLQAESSAVETIMSLKNTSTNGRDWWFVSGGAGGAASGGRFTIFDATGGGSRLTIDTIGNVGIGTSSPTSKLDVIGNTYFSGRVGIGTSSPNRKLQVVDNSSIHIAEFVNNDTSINADGISIKLGRLNPVANNTFIWFTGGSGTPGYINGNGVGGVNYVSASDARLKTKIDDFTGGMDMVSRMNVRKYEFIKAPGYERIGFLAQELQTVLPEAVSGDPEGDVTKEPMGIDYSKLTPVLVSAIQELKAENEALKTEINEIKEALGL